MTPRHTDDPDEVRHLIGLPDVYELIGRHGRVFLKDNRYLDGIILPGRVGNNAGQGGRWQYYGSIVLRTSTEDIEIDYLDVTTMV